MNKIPLPTGKIPPEILREILGGFPQEDDRVLLGPGVGLDCAVVKPSQDLLVFKSDPITFATDEIGWYAVQINANDVATTGAAPRWFMVTALLPEEGSTPELARRIAGQIREACNELGVTVIGGHTEITHGLDRPILNGTMIGEVAPDRLVTPKGARPGDRIMLTKGVPVEATAILGREFPRRLADVLSAEDIEKARSYLYRPGISVVRDAAIAVNSGRISAMHDPTEGGLAGALWELAVASGRSLLVDTSAVPVSTLSARVCASFGIDPLATIASGALLFCVHPADAENVQRALESEGILCAEIGEVEANASRSPAEVWRVVSGRSELLPFPARDEIARCFEETNGSSGGEPIS